MTTFFEGKFCKVVYHNNNRGDQVIRGFVSVEDDYFIVNTFDDVIKIFKNDIVKIQLSKSDKKGEHKRNNKRFFKDNFSYKKWWKDSNVKEAE